MLIKDKDCCKREVLEENWGRGKKERDLILAQNDAFKFYVVPSN